MSQVNYSSKAYQNSLAVIGMAGRFPKSDNIAAFWQQLIQGKDLLTHFSDQQLQQTGIAKRLLTDKRYIKSRGILANIDRFDAEFFHISAYEAAMMDPQQRLWLETAWQALDLTGYCKPAATDLTGVFAAIADNSYLTHMLKNHPECIDLDDYQTALACSPHFAATRLSYLLDLKGPSMTISTACSSSLVAVIQACESLLRGDCDLAIAGGAALKIPQQRGYLAKEAGILSQDGYCRPFDAQASGTVSSAAVGVIILKRLEEAIAANDSIHAIIRAYHVNNDGAAKASYSAPSLLEQARCVATSLAQIDAETITYLEAHGTGTFLGDPIELNALTKAYRHYTNKCQYCALGSVKANMGHADTASGIASLIKTVLVLKNQQIPPLLHFRSYNPHCHFENSPFYINATLQHWQAQNFPRRAGVNSLGIGGTNAHLILEEYQGKNPSSITVSSHSFAGKRHWLEAKKPHTKPARPTYYRAYWELYPFTEQTQQVQSQGIWLVFDDPTQRWSQVLKTMISQPVITVTQANTFSQQDANHYQIKAASAAQYSLLFNALSDKQIATQGIIYAWSLQQIDTLATINSLCHLAKAGFNRRQKPRLLTLLSTDVFKVKIQETPNPNQTMLSVFALVMQQEYSVATQLLDITANTIPCPSILGAALTPDTPTRLAYRQGDFFTHAYKKIRLKNPLSNSDLKQQGCYLITGALGRMGLLLAEYLASHSQATLILLAKQEKPQLTARLRALKQQAHALAIYYGDISSADTSNALLAKLTKNHAVIDGIFHCAGMLTKQTINDYNISLFKQITAAKVEGTKQLAELVAHYQPRFCLLTSSTASILGGVGMAAYASANAFLDAYAAQQTSQPTRWLSINWDALDFTECSSTDNTRLTASMIKEAWHTIMTQQTTSNSLIVTTKDFIAQSEALLRPHSNVTATAIQQAPACLEKSLLALFQRFLGSQVNEKDNFYNQGGHSLLAIELLAAIESELGVAINLADFTQHNSVEQLVNYLSKGATKSYSKMLVCLNNANSSLPKLFLIHPISGSVFCYQAIAQALSDNCVCYAIQDKALYQPTCQYSSLQAMATMYKTEIESVQQDGAYYLGGYSFGGTLAFEIAQQLLASGKTVANVLLIDSWASFSDTMKNQQRFLAAKTAAKQQLKDVSNKQQRQLLLAIQWQRMQLLFDYQAHTSKLSLQLIKATQLLPEYVTLTDPNNYWQQYTSQVINTQRVNANHDTILAEQNIPIIAEYIKITLTKDKHYEISS